MRTIDALAYFGSQKRLADLLGISRIAVHKWGEFVPEARQLRIEVMSRGNVKADAHLRRAAPAGWVSSAQSHSVLYQKLSKTKRYAGATKQDESVES